MSYDLFTYLKKKKRFPQELAKRFSVMFGLDAVKNREALTALHRAGVAFAALEPRHLLFLEPLAELSNKLLRQDKRHVLKVPEPMHSLPYSSDLLRVPN